MTRHFEIPQRSADWFTARAGLATTSNFDKIITKTGRDSAQADAYANMLIAELILNRPIVRDFSAYACEWGETYEAEAVALYRFETGLDVRDGGFFTNDAMTVGASPDARCYDGETMVGLAEIKCPENPAIHIEFLLMNEMNPKYIPQVQGQMFVSGAEWVDWFSYYPELPSARIRTYRDEKYIALLENAMTNFEDLMQLKIQTLIKLGHIAEAPKKHITDDVDLRPQMIQEGVGY